MKYVPPTFNRTQREPGLSVGSEGELELLLPGNPNTDLPPLPLDTPPGLTGWLLRGGTMRVGEARRTEPRTSRCSGCSMVPVPLGSTTCNSAMFFFSSFKKHTHTRTAAQLANDTLQGEYVAQPTCKQRIFFSDGSAGIRALLLTLDRLHLQDQRLTH